MSSDLNLGPPETALLIDLYQLTMAASLFEQGHNDNACFEVTVRRMPAERGYLMFAGLERVLEAFDDFRFGPEALSYLESLNLFKPEFIHFLGSFRFTGDLLAMPEGTVFFAGEPVLQVSAPLIEALMMETMILNQVGLATLVATKAARIYDVAMGRRLVEFGLRRSQGADAGLIAARSSYIAGFAGTSNVLAGKRYGIPVFGTMSHAYVMAYEREAESFEAFTKTFPQASTLLVDTYDTLHGVENAARLGQQLKQRGARLQGVRLDSGNLADLSRRARAILDHYGLQDTSIVASGNLDEYKIAALLAAEASIDAFGVGTALVVSDDAPAADLTYKLVEYGGRPRLKTSAAKLTMPGRKQVFRAADAESMATADIVGLLDEGSATIKREFGRSVANVEPLLAPHIKNGSRLTPRPTLAQTRERALASLASIDPNCRAITRPGVYPMKYSAALNAMLVSEKLRAERRQD